VAQLRARGRRDRKGRIRPYYSIRLRDGSEIGVGRNRRAAEILESEFEIREELERRGVKLPTRSPWTVANLRAWDLRVAQDEGGELASRRRRWDVLELELEAETPIEDLTPARIQRAVDRWLAAGAGPATVNRNLAVLRKALARAREPRSGSLFEGDPLRGIANLRERATRKKPVPRRREEIDALLEAAHRHAAAAPSYAMPGELLQDAQIAEILYLTGSRLSQVLRLRRDQVIEHPTHGPLLRFPATQAREPAVLLLPRPARRDPRVDRGRRFRLVLPEPADPGSAARGAAPLSLLDREGRRRPAHHRAHLPPLALERRARRGRLDLRGAGQARPHEPAHHRRRIRGALPRRDSRGEPSRSRPRCAAESCGFAREAAESSTKERCDLAARARCAENS
jgi:integrase